MGMDLTHLTRDERNVIASFFLENMVFSKEEIEEIFRDNLEKREWLKVVKCLARWKQKISVEEREALQNGGNEYDSY